MSMFKRWNFVIEDSKIVVCKGQHEKHEPCEYEQLKVEELHNIILQLQSENNKLQYEQSKRGELVSINIAPNVHTRLKYIMNTRDFSQSEAIQFLLDHQI